MRKLIASAYTKLFWIEYQLNPERYDYNIASVQTINGKLNVSRLRNALRRLVSDYLLLNSHIVELDGDLYWEKNSSIEELKVFRTIDNIQSFIMKPFNLIKGPLYRFALFEEKSKEYKFISVIHHVLIDGYSGDESLSLVSNYYNNSIVAIPREQFSAIENINKLINKRIVAVQNKGANQYWQKRLQGLPPKNRLPYNKSHLLQQPQICEQRFSIQKNKQVKLFRKNLGTTWFTIFASFWGVLINKYCDDDISYISYPIGIKEGKNFMYGAQVNTIILPITINKSSTFRSVIKRVTQIIKSAKINCQLSYNYLPTNEILSCSKVKSLNVAIAQTHLKEEVFSLDGCNIKVDRQYNLEIAGAELFLEHQETATSLNFKLLYKANLFNKKFIQQLKNYFIQLFYGAIDNVDAILARLMWIDPVSLRKLAKGYGEKEYLFSGQQTLIQLFEKQVKLKPEALSVIFQEKSLTYSDLNRKANQLARHIRNGYEKILATKMSNNTLIPFCIDRNEQLVIAMLAILKSGGAYVPIDPKAPTENFFSLLKESNARILLTHSTLDEKLLSTLGKLEIQQIYMDGDTFVNELDTNLNIKYNATDLAYVLYTSGTTGLPKGIMVQHNNVISLLNANYFQDYFEKRAQWTMPTFDVSVLEIFSALCNGNELYLVSDKERMNPKDYFNYISKYKIQFAFIPPFFLKELSDYIESGNKLKLTRILTGLEKINGKDIETLIEHKIEVLNGYGPTETTVCSTALLLKTHRYKDTNIPIGKSLQNQCCFILDQYLNPVPINAMGELYIGGSGVSRGYLNQPELTKKKFINNPFATAEDRKKGYTRLYKNGDLVRWLDDGYIEYIRRDDFQIKVRGFRIEPQEIETILLSISGIKFAYVAKDDKHFSFGKSGNLIGYYLIDNKVKLSEKNTLKPSIVMEHLRKKLPEYMLPAKLIELSFIPLTQSGKFDRKQLSSLSTTFDKRQYTKPRNKLEESLCQIWQEILEINRIGIHEDFFMLGGDSVRAVKLVNKIDSFLKLRIVVADIFRTRTVDKLADLIRTYDNKFSLVKPYKIFSIKSLPQLVFIHPARSGSEVYYELAGGLSEYYFCIGIDNYNIHNPNSRIESLHSLAKYYLVEYQKLYKITKPIYLCGWSFGGQIALEIACLLELAGHKEINVILLDTILPDEKINKLCKVVDQKQLKKEKIKSLQIEGYESWYIDKIIDAMDTEQKLGNDPISGKLRYTKVILLKATKIDPDLDLESLNKVKKYALSLENNNINIVAKNIEKYYLNCHHGNMIKLTRDIVKVIKGLRSI